MNNNKNPHGVCEIPHHNCTMNYCDQLGCIYRDRFFAGETNKMSTDNQLPVHPIINYRIREYLYLVLAIGEFILFAYNIENDRGFWAWMWLLISILNYTKYLKLNRQNEQQ